MTPPSSSSSSPPFSPGAPLEIRLTTVLDELETLAKEVDGDPEALLSLLRRVEGLHRGIQDGPFRSSLPSDRHQLFTLLQTMERSGGWPYIPRLQLRTFLDLLDLEPSQQGDPLAA